MRLAIAISVVAASFVFSAARADEQLIKVTLDAGSAYIVTEGYATAHRSEVRISIPGLRKFEGFWTPTEVDVIVADRAFRDLLLAAVKDPTLLFPDLAPNPDPAAPANLAAASELANERNELALVSGNYGGYSRQYVGIIVDGQKLIFCNYADGAKVDPSTDYIFIQKVFVRDAGIHFLQCRFDPLSKTCSNVSMIGSWQQ